MPSPSKIRRVETRPAEDFTQQSRRMVEAVTGSKLGTAADTGEFSPEFLERLRKEKECQAKAMRRK